MPEKKPLKFYNWNAEIVPDESGSDQEIEVSFRLQGVNRDSAFVHAFQSGKYLIEGLQGGGSFVDYMVPLMNLIMLVVSALKKSK